MRDFIMSWFNINAEGYGISNDPAFLELVQAALTNVIGNLFFRAGHLKPLSFALDGASEAVRQHVAHYADMRRRAAEQHPGLFEALPDEVMLERGRRRRATAAAPRAGSGLASQPSATATGAADGQPDNEGEWGDGRAG